MSKRKETCYCTRIKSCRPCKEKYPNYSVEDRFQKPVKFGRLAVILLVIAGLIADAYLFWLIFHIKLRWI